MTEKYDHLRIQVSRWWRIKARFMQFLQLVIYKAPILGKILRRLAGILSYAGNLGAAEELKRKYRNGLKETSGEPQKFGSSFGYTEVQEFEMVFNYHKQLLSDKFAGSRFEGELLYKYIIELVGELLKKDTRIRNFLNFGVGYAHIDSELAKKFPNVNFIGIDRSKYTKLYNEWHFANMKNMEFIADDIMNLLSGRKFNNDVFFHTRTMLIMPKHFVEKLYQKVFDAGFKYIVGFEQLGISRANFRDYEFSDEDKPDQWFRAWMYLHNYPGIAQKANFDILETKLLKTNHPHQDYRILYFLATRAKD